ncbi:UDP-N-acetylmuramoyl-L-alanyl-D-glutamate--2,6-diaminopimelate ligase [bacterium]|nr:UDP-N-acetylmuramoyl-L-alanyl-D-glutamate--2,6-diaminopimelate ligase [Pelagibacteraceae bacterium]MDC3130882.1 UDP-N-acetylmuramoyl-L-alanyl-D-glutamate--2,6-diaminopimelate ligase [bacterium]
MAPNLLLRIQANNIAIAGIACDSRRVKKNYLFFAMEGSNTDGNKFIKKAIEKKPSAIITSKKNKIKTNIPIILVKNVRKEYASIIYKLSQSNIEKKVAITGTNGKTSVVYYVQYLLNSLGNKCGIIGTLGNNSKYIKSNLTTPDPLQISQIIQRLGKEKYKTIAMEASSHALDQGRLYGLNFDILALTNISHDHLDYHKTINSYINAKLKLFKENTKKNTINIISKDFKYYSQISRELKSKKIKFLTFGLKNSDFQIYEKYKSRSNITMQLNYASKKYLFKFTNMPKFQINNFLLAVSIVFKLGYRLQDMKSLSLEAPSVPGRMELAGIKKNKAKIFIDFAHTPDALANVLKEAREMCTGKLHVVFGCGGDRDKEKRPVMGKIATKYADKIIITDDNPRNEDPDIIRKEIIGISKNMQEIGDRRSAIKYAANSLRNHDILVIAGKGHEKYQIIKNKSLPFDDVQISKKYL